MRGALLVSIALGWLAAQTAPAQVDLMVPDQHLETYFGRKPDTFLADPQRLLSNSDRRQREEFLAYHSEDSEIDFYLLLFDKEQTIPPDVRVEELGERFFGEGRPSLIALYFLGQPDRVKLILSPRIAEVLQPAELERLRRQAVQAAEAKTVAAEQLEEFCIQLAIGIFWIEQEAGLEGGPSGAGPGEKRGDGTPGRQPENSLMALLDQWVTDWGVPIGVVAGGILAASLATFVLRRRARYRFPERLPPPRLGGKCGAGVGAVIDFRSSTQSPSRQKGDPNDSLGGL
ncbi:hypothetical protein [Haloferula sp. A504]|uniref:hypothetical protein n=1 Tax=Haloferula sp. A504 TaxID=3373601 RepID=UPI0031BD5399|nr:hypothetical protein [Verrucomicrobiaceae bacterium E54]